VRGARVRKALSGKTFRRGLAVLPVLAVLAAGCSEAGLPTLDTTATATAAVATAAASPGGVPTPTAASVTLAKRELAAERVAVIPGKLASYERDKFGDAWSDAAKGVADAGNGCDTRNDILRRDAQPGTVKTKAGTTGCKVIAGVWISPYTGAKMTNKTLVQIDHIVPLGRAWASGAKDWTAARRLAFGNDPDNLVAVDGHSNTSKGDKGPSAWKPAAPYQCLYAVRYLNSLTKYKLPITSADKTALTTMLGSCKR
jgi:hypothetical protein